MEYQLSYDEVRNLSEHKWRTEGAKAAVTYVESMVAGTTGELRGRLLTLLGDWRSEAGELDMALGAYVDALELVSNPQHKFVALACAMNACVESKRWKQGMRYCFDAEKILNEHTDIPVKWLGVYYANSGRLAMNASDYVSATDDLRLAARHFRATSMETEAQNMECYLIEALISADKVEESAEMCRNLRAHAAGEFIRFRLDTLESMIHSRLGNIPEAKRLAMRSWETVCKKLGKMMHETFIMSLCAAAEVVKYDRGGDAGDILRYFIQTLSSYGQIDADQIMKEMMK